MAIKSIEERIKDYENAYAGQVNREIAEKNKIYDTQRQQATDTYNRQIKETNNSYEDLYRENAVQRLINEREIAENMASLGLTDSGLNRTQQTAVQLSHANNKNKIDINRQKAVDSLTASLADAIKTIDMNRSSAESEIRSGYYNLAVSNAQKAYQTDVEAETARQKAAYDYSVKMYKAQQSAAKTAQKESQKANYIIQTSGGLLNRNLIVGTLQENNINVIHNPTARTYTYVDNNSGKKSTFEEGVNPFTGTKNPDVWNGVFSNGYQPNNVNNKKLYKVDGVSITVNGNNQSVWKTGAGKYYFWDGASNKYELMSRDELKECGINR